MMQIHPYIEQKFACPVCGQEMEAKKIVWQGIHTCVESECKECQRTFYQDLRIGQSIFTQYSVDINTFELFGLDRAEDWYGIPFQNSLKYPNNKKIDFEKVIYKLYDKIIIINCIDYLYGHSLLKLLNAEKHLKNNPQFGVIVIVPKFLEWMLPKGIAEKWVFNIPLKSGQDFFIDFNNIIQNEIKRFSEVHICKATHPKYFNITNFTGVKIHDFQKEDFRITFIWRENRIWINSSLFQKIINKLNLKILKNGLLSWQKRKVVKLFSKLRKTFPNSKFTVAGIGNYDKFPFWIDNKIVNNISDDIEKELCEIYSDSRIVIGVHGSNMLLPSAHAGMIIDLMPTERWGNFAQDILYQEQDIRISNYRYRYIPINQKTNFVSQIIVSMILGRNFFR